jgi:uncharacterized protein (DUF2062 family)
MKKLKIFLNKIYLWLVKINDTPQKISLGLAAGVILGILPGTGPIAAVTVAFILRLNRMAALMGSLMVNTWLSIVTFVLAIKLGAKVFGINWQDIYHGWYLFLKGFQWSGFLKLSVYKIILPILVGYAIISLVAGILVYLLSIIILTCIKIDTGHGDQNGNKHPG